MKICVLFRGENVRHTRGTMISLNNIDNWKKYIYAPLLAEGHEVKTLLVTYETEILETLSKELQADVLVGPRISQVENMKSVVDFMKTHKNEFDRFLILRFDFFYKFPVTEWPKWNERGILLPNRDEHWCREHLYSDAIFVIDSHMVDIFHVSVHQLPQGRLPHDCGKFLYENDIPIHIMYDEFLSFFDHPLYMLANGYVVDPPRTYTVFNDISKSVGISPLTLVSILIDSEETFDAKRMEIDYLATKYDILDFKCEFPEKVKTFYSGKKYLFEKAKISSLEIELKTYEIPAEK